MAWKGSGVRFPSAPLASSPSSAFTPGQGHQSFRATGARTSRRARRSDRGPEKWRRRPSDHGPPGACEVGCPASAGGPAGHAAPPDRCSTARRRVATSSATSRQTQVATAGVGAEQLERRLDAHARSLGHETLRLLDRDSGLERAAELLGDRRCLPQRSLVQDPDRGDVRERLGEGDVALAESGLAAVEEVQGTDHGVADPHGHRRHRSEAALPRYSANVGHRSPGSSRSTFTTGSPRR